MNKGKYIVYIVHNNWYLVGDILYFNSEDEVVDYCFSKEGTKDMRVGDKFHVVKDGKMCELLTEIVNDSRW